MLRRSSRHPRGRQGGQGLSDDVWMRGLGTPLWVQFRQFSDDPAEIEAMVATYREYNLAHHDEMVRPYQGVVEAVRSLHRGANVLGLVTSKMRSGAVRGLRIAGLEDAFDVIVGADEVTHPKPHPEPVLIALERLGAPPESPGVIAASRPHLECGRARGVKTPTAQWGPSRRAH